MANGTLSASKKRLKNAVHRSGATSREGILERLFTFAFKGLVYPQIWEDPDVDMKALRLTPESRMITIASGGCNVMSYLTANPAEITAVDLNRAHVALGRLKLAAAKYFPNYETFYRFFGEADEKANVAAYQRFLKDNLDPETIAYWEGRDLANWGRKRITLFSRDLYHHGLLGYCIGLGHLVARLYGIDPKHMVKAKSLEEQRSFFDTALAPLFDKRLVRWATSKKCLFMGWAFRRRSMMRLSQLMLMETCQRSCANVSKSSPVIFPCRTTILPGRHSGVDMHRTGTGLPENLDRCRLI